MSTVIKVQNLSKQYRLGNVGLGSLGADVNRWWQTKILGNEDPYLKIGEENNREVIGNSEYVWALRNINFDVQQGEVLGIIGRNGAGKSTLLKILSRTTGPTTGSIRIKGRVASLLEVGTGFHPELTGRENIFLNGAILGMTKDEIRRKFDEIVTFAGVERYVDTPVKRYSSGMYVRLAFAVAAHLEPEILIVDEVLAVGDAEFQKKAIGKMKEVSEGQGRTVLFVSHNLNSISQLCNRGMLLENGKIELLSEVSKVIDLYNRKSIKNKSKSIKIFKKNKKAWCKSFSIKSLYNNEGLITTSDKVKFILEIEAIEEIKNVFVGFGINDINQFRLFTLFSKSFSRNYILKKGITEVSCFIENLPLKPGEYFVEIYIGDDVQQLDYYKDGLSFEVGIPSDIKDILPSGSQGSLHIDQIWN